MSEARALYMGVAIERVGTQSCTGYWPTVRVDSEKQAYWNRQLYALLREWPHDGAWHDRWAAAFRAWVHAW